MDWCKFLMWTAVICMSVALFLQNFLPEADDMALAWFGCAIMVVITAYLMDDGE